jgi:hypothetical protein
VKFQNSLIAALIAAILTFHVTKPDTPVDPNRPVDPVVTPVDPNAPGTPVSFDGFRVIVLEESGDRSRDLASRLVASPGVSGYLNSHCDGGAQGWRRWDVEVETANVPAAFRELMAVPRPAPPCVVIASKKRAVALPISTSTTAESFVEMLKPYGGP